jgi:hypothetical protein
MDLKEIVRDGLVRNYNFSPTVGGSCSQKFVHWFMLNDTDQHMTSINKAMSIRYCNLLVKAEFLPACQQNGGYISG